jgi:hypothetical protein
MYCIAQLDIEPVQNVTLPQIVLGIDPRLDLLVVGNAQSGSIECRPRLLDLRYELLQVRQRVCRSRIGLSAPLVLLTSSLNALDVLFAAVVRVVEPK